MLRLNLVHGLEAMREVRADFEEGRNHLARHISHMRSVSVSKQGDEAFGHQEEGDSPAGLEGSG